MKKTFTTQIPDQAGAFLAASQIVSAAGANITRVSYNRAVDLHMLFLEVDGDGAQLKRITEELGKVGYLKNEDEGGRVILIECKVEDHPGGILPVLELISRYRFNIPYISSQENGTRYQYFKIGIYLENSADITEFIEQASALCEVRIIDYQGAEKTLDNTVFYVTFSNGIAQKLSLSREQAGELMVNANQIMQLLDEQGKPPYKTFDYIGRFADALVKNQGAGFAARISQRALGQGMLYLIEPPCGSNVYIIERNGKLLFIDSGFALYQEEMLLILRQLFEGFDGREKLALLTHADLDHCGLLHLFDRVYLCQRCLDNFRAEWNGLPGAREHTPLHAAYISIARVLSGYHPPDLSRLTVIGGAEKREPGSLSSIGEVVFEGLSFRAYEGSGGHVDGETVFLCKEERLAFTGDIYVNIKGFTKAQAGFNRLAPFLMNSVDTDPKEAALERANLMRLLRDEGGCWSLCGGHGAIAPFGS